MLVGRSVDASSKSSSMGSNTHRGEVVYVVHTNENDDRERQTRGAKPERATAKRG